MNEITKDERTAFGQELKQMFNIPKDLDSVPVSSANFSEVFKAFEGKKYCGVEIGCEGRVAIRTELPETANDGQPYIGVQCLRDFKAHETVAVSPGIYIDRKVDTHIFVFDDHDGKKLIHVAKLDGYAYDWGDKWELAMLPHFFNHSCSANVYWKSVYDDDDQGCEPGGVGVGPIAILKAKRDIKAGEFVSVDYHTVFLDALHSFRCLCGSDTCKGNITGFNTLPEKEQDSMITLTPYVLDPTWLAEWLGEHLKDEERRKKLLKGLSENELMPKDNMDIIKGIMKV